MKAVFISIATSRGVAGVPYVMTDSRTHPFFNSPTIVRLQEGQSGILLSRQEEAGKNVFSKWGAEFGLRQKRCSLAQESHKMPPGEFFPLVLTPDHNMFLSFNKTLTEHPALPGPSRLWALSLDTEIRKGSNHAKNNTWILLLLIIISQDYLVSTCSALGLQPSTFNIGSYLILKIPCERTRVFPFLQIRSFRKLTN